MHVIYGYAECQGNTRPLTASLSGAETQRAQSPSDTPFCDPLQPDAGIAHPKTYCTDSVSQCVHWTCGPFRFNL